MGAKRSSRSRSRRVLRVVEGGWERGCWVGVSKEIRRSFVCGREGVWRRSGDDVFWSNILLTRWIVFGGRGRIVEGASGADYNVIISHILSA